MGDGRPANAQGVFARGSSRINALLPSEHTAATAALAVLRYTSYGME